MSCVEGGELEKLQFPPSPPPRIWVMYLMTWPMAVLWHLAWCPLLQVRVGLVVVGVAIGLGFKMGDGLIM